MFLENFVKYFFDILVYNSYNFCIVNMLRRVLVFKFDFVNKLSLLLGNVWIKIVVVNLSYLLVS